MSENALQNLFDAVLAQGAHALFHRHLGEFVDARAGLQQGGGFQACR